MIIHAFTSRSTCIGIAVRGRIGCGGLGSAAASDQDERRRDEVRHAVEAGEIRPLADILKAVRDKLPGEVAGVEIDREDGRWRYEFRVVDGQGRLFEVYIDARNGDDRTYQGEVMRVLLVEDDRRIAADVERALEAARLCGRDRARRRGGLVPRRHRGLRRGHPRSRPAGHGRAGGAQALARATTGICRC